MGVASSHLRIDRISRVHERGLSGGCARVHGGLSRTLVIAFPPAVTTHQSDVAPVPEQREAPAASWKPEMRNASSKTRKTLFGFENSSTNS